MMHNIHNFAGLHHRLGKLPLRNTFSQPPEPTQDLILDGDVFRAFRMLARSTQQAAWFHPKWVPLQEICFSLDLMSRGEQAEFREDSSVRLNEDQLETLAKPRPPLYYACFIRRSIIDPDNTGAAHRYYELLFLPRHDGHLYILFDRFGLKDVFPREEPDGVYVTKLLSLPSPDFWLEMEPE